LAGISYSTARAWFGLPGFPAFRGVVFWSDFVQWRHAETGLRGSHAQGWRQSEPNNPKGAMNLEGKAKLPPRAADILAEAG
jgi:hypothetical protein